MPRRGPRELEGIDSAVDSFFAVIGYVTSFLFRGSARRRVVQDFAEHVRIIVERKLPLVEGIERFAESQRSLGVRYVMRSVAELLHAGRPLHEAMAELCPAFFPKDCVSMVRAGEVSGRLPEALGTIVEDLRFHRDVKIRYTFTCLYLGFIFLFGLLVGGAILTFVFPRFVEFYQMAGRALPAESMVVFQLVSRGAGGAFLPGVLYLLPLVLIGVFILSRYELGIPEWLASVMPGVRGAYLRYQRGRFLSALGMFLAGRMPVEEAVASAAAAGRLKRLRRMAEAAWDPLLNGVPLGEVLGTGRVLTDGMLWRIRSAERRGDLPEVLGTLGAEEQEAGHRRWVYLLAWFRPAAVITLGILEFVIVRATYAPLFYIGELVFTEPF